MIIAALALAGVFVALYLTLYKVGAIGKLTCSIGGCERVNTSQWATFLGAPVAMWGLVFYVTTFVIAYVGTLPRFEDRAIISWILLLMSATGVVFSGWLTYLELFVIDAICQYCVGSAVIVTLVFLVSVSEWWSVRRRA